MLFAPLITGERVFGRISLQNLDRTDAFSEADVRLLTTLASSLSVALENARLVDETRHRASELATVNEVSQAAGRQLELDKLIDLVGDQLAATFAADIVYIALVDRESAMIEFPYYIENGRHEQQQPLAHGQGLTSRILDAREPLLLNQSEHFEKLGTRGVGTPRQVVPGRADRRRRTSPSARSASRARPRRAASAADDARLLSTLASNVGTAIQNARLYSESQRRASEMAALADVGREISATLDLESLLQRIVELAAKLLDGTSSAVYLADDDGDDVPRHRRDRRHRRAAQGRSPSSATAASSARLPAEARPEMVNDVASDPRGRAHRGNAAQEEDERLMVAPLDRPRRRHRHDGRLAYRPTEPFVPDGARLPGRAVAAGGDRHRQRPPVCRRARGREAAARPPTRPRARSSPR